MVVQLPLHDPQTSLAGELHEVVLQGVGDVMLAVVDDLEDCPGCCWLAPNISGCDTGQVDIHPHQVVRRYKQVVCILNIQIHSGDTSWVVSVSRNKMVQCLVSVSY